MSNRICGRCKSSVVVPWNNVKDFYKCMNCSAVGYAEKFPEKTLFNHITVSPEVLAESVVYTYEMAIGGSMFRVYWTSPFVENLYLDKSEAIAATVERFKEVAK